MVCEMETQIKEKSLNRLNFPVKIAFRTDTITWDKVNLIKYTFGFKTRSDALDYLIHKGFEDLNDGKKNKRK